jgi:hypothetical protein
MAQRHSNHWFPELLKDKFVKIAFKVILSLAILFLIYIVGKAIFGYPVKIFGFEVNSPISKTDTIFKKDSNNTPNRKITDTPVVTQKYNPSKIVLVAPTVKGKPIPKDTVSKVQSTVTGDNNKTVVGNNSGIVGDVTINNGNDQRHLTTQYATMFIKRFEDTLRAHNLTKLIPIEFGFTMGSDESLAFTNEVANFLYDRGYTNISHNVGPTMGNNTLRILYLDGHIFIDVGMKPPR